MAEPTQHELTSRLPQLMERADFRSNHPEIFSQAVRDARSDFGEGDLTNRLMRDGGSITLPSDPNPVTYSASDILGNKELFLAYQREQILNYLAPDVREKMAAAGRSISEEQARNLTEEVVAEVQGQKPSTERIKEITEYNRAHMGTPAPDAPRPVLRPTPDKGPVEIRRA